MTNETEAAPGSIPKFILILAPSATGLSKPDLHVFAKLFEDCLKRGLEAQALGVRLAVMTMSWISSSDTLSMSI